MNKDLSDGERSRKVLTEQIFDSFIEKISKERGIEDSFIKSLKVILDSGTVKKEDILKLLEEEKNEDS